MLHKTKGIVLSYLKYGETSIIVQVYTQAFGVQSYIENGVRKAKAKNKIALFQPLTLLDLVVYKKQNTSLNRISEMKCYHPYQQMPYDVVKSTIAIFLSEVLSILLRGEEEANEALYQFLESSLTGFDAANSSYTNFHLKFLLALSQYLGFAPSNAEEVLEELRPFQSVRLNLEQRAQFNSLLEQKGFFEALRLSSADRQLFLRVILQFYQIHSHSLKEIRSIKVLQEVLH